MKPRELGGITAYNMNTGDKAWWIPNGGRMGQPTVNANIPDAALFADVKLPMRLDRPRPAAGHHTKTLVIYGTGRSGGAPGCRPQLYARRQGDGQAGGGRQHSGPDQRRADDLHAQGRQYIVFATGGGKTTELIALALPN